LNIGLIRKEGLSINDYLILYNIANNNELSTILLQSFRELSLLERKGYIKITTEGIYLRARSNVFFTVKGDDYFSLWLKEYPIRVNKSSGGSRALSPESENTIIGKALRKKWNITFKKDIEAQRRALNVLKLQIKDMTKSGDLEYMVEATRWLNQGYFEKYGYLLDDNKDRKEYDNEDYY
jgi:hypothetical protein